jgi:hypothetical protein
VVNPEVAIQALVLRESPKTIKWPSERAADRLFMLAVVFVEFALLGEGLFVLAPHVRANKREADGSFATPTRWLGVVCCCSLVGVVAVRMRELGLGLDDFGWGWACCCKRRGRTWRVRRRNVKSSLSEWRVKNGRKKLILGRHPCHVDGARVAASDGAGVGGIVHVELLQDMAQCVLGVQKVVTGKHVVSNTGGGGIVHVELLRDMAQCVLGVQKVVTGKHVVSNTGVWRNV